MDFKRIASLPAEKGKFDCTLISGKAPLPSSLVFFMNGSIRESPFSVGIINFAPLLKFSMVAGRTAPAVVSPTKVMCGNPLSLWASISLALLDSRSTMRMVGFFWSFSNFATMLITKTFPPLPLRSMTSPLALEKLLCNASFSIVAFSLDIKFHK